MAIVSVLKESGPAAESSGDPAGVFFGGTRAGWRPAWDQVWAHVTALGDDTSVQPTQKYLGLARSGRKYAVVAATADRFDLGYKLDPLEVIDGAAAAGSWNRMVTHRSSLVTGEAVTAAHLRLLADAYRRAAR
jgi:hypothetical protein